MAFDEKFGTQGSGDQNPLNDAKNVNFKFFMFIFIILFYLFSKILFYFYTITNYYSL